MLVVESDALQLVVPPVQEALASRLAPVFVAGFWVLLAVGLVAVLVPVLHPVPVSVALYVALLLWEVQVV